MQGLDNLGSTCAINSLIQIICRSDNLRNIILNSNLDENTLTYQLKEILDIMYNKNKSLKPYKFINFLYDTFSSIFDRNEQIDLYELWLFISNKIIEENSFKPLLVLNEDNLMNKHDNTIARYNNYKTCDYLEYIQGSFIQIIECHNCKFKHINFEPFISILLDINDDNNPTIADLLTTTLKMENITSSNQPSWTCDKCNKKSTFNKIKKIWKIPKTLILIINRFKSINNKNNNTIYINNDIVFKKNSLLFNENDIVFDLKSIGLHDGNLHGGHYTALCKVSDKIFIYNDNIITEIDNNLFNKLLEKNNRCYMVVYELRN